MHRLLWDISISQVTSQASKGARRTPLMTHASGSASAKNRFREAMPCQAHCPSHHMTRQNHTFWTRSSGVSGFRTILLFEGGHEKYRVLTAPFLRRWGSGSRREKTDKKRYGNGRVVTRSTTRTITVAWEFCPLQFIEEHDRFVVNFYVIHCVIRFGCFVRSQKDNSVGFLLSVGCVDLLHES